MKIGTSWIFFILMGLFALNAVGLFQVIPGLESSGLQISAILSAALVFGLFLYLSYESNRNAKEAERKLTALGAGLEAGVQGLKRTVEDATSSTKARIGEIEGTVVKAAATTTSVEAQLTGVKNRVREMGGSLEKIDSKALSIQGGLSSSEKTLQELRDVQSAMHEGVSSSEQTLQKLREAQTDTHESIGELDGKVSGFQPVFTRIEGAQAQIQKPASGDAMQVQVVTAGATSNIVTITVP